MASLIIALQTLPWMHLHYTSLHTVQCTTLHLTAHCAVHLHYTSLHTVQCTLCSAHCVHCTACGIVQVKIKSKTNISSWQIIQMCGVKNDVRWCFTLQSVLQYDRMPQVLFVVCCVLSHCTDYHNLKAGHTPVHYSDYTLYTIHYTLLYLSLIHI